MMTLKELVEYEIAGSGWASYISNPVLQQLAANWFVSKTKRKFKRLQKALGYRAVMEKVCKQEQSEQKIVTDKL
jgi:hypothetical protein